MIRQSSKILALALVYYLAAQLGLRLAIPPGYATPIWPGAGIALAAVLVFGNRLAPGIWLGAFLANLATSFDPSSAASLARSLLVPLGIGAGTTLQAILGAALVRRFVGYPTALLREREVIKFLVLGGPLSCLIAASVGVSTLIVASKLPALSYAFSWWTWWVGDAIGVLVVTPLVLTALGKPRAVWRRRWKTVAIPLCLALAVVFGVFDGAQGAFLTSPHSLAAWIVLACGLALTGLLGAFLLVVSGHAWVFEQMAGECRTELERKQQAEEALRCERSQLQAILYNAPMLIMIKDLDGSLMLANRGILPGGDTPPAQEVAGSSMFEDLAERWGSADLAALRCDGPSRSEETIRLADGSSHTYLNVKFPVSYFDNEEPFGLCTIATDITERKRMELALRESEAQLRATFEQATVGIAHISLPACRFLRVNDALCRMTDYECGELLSRTAFDLIYPKDCLVGRGQYRQLLRKAIASFSTVKRYMRKDQQVIWARVTLSSVCDEHGKVPYLMAVVEDITEAKLAEQARQDTERRLQLAVDIAQLGFWEWNAESNKVYWSQLFKKQLGYDDLELPSFEKWQSRLHPDDRERMLEYFTFGVERPMSDCYEEVQYRLRHSDCSYHWFLARAMPVIASTGQVLKLVGTHLDISERKFAEQRIREAAQHDELTGLPNRALLFEYAGHLIAAAQRSHTRGALLFIDLDRFKPINDLYGHEVGDRLLQEVAKRLAECIRHEDLVGRIGGDEFVIVLPHLANSYWAATVAQHVLDKLGRPFQIGSLELSVSSSIGISHFPQHGSDVDALVHAADVAMYQAKQSGRGQYHFYAPELGRRANEAFLIETQLKQSLKNDGLTLHYQPIIDMQSNRPVGAEALLRLADVDAMTLGPARFVPVAESAGLIDQLGEWVAVKACRQHQEWRCEGLPPIMIAINVSPLQFHKKAFAEWLAGIVAEAGIDPGYLQIEVTESTVMEHIERAIETLTRIKSLGIKVALDDFGTGHSSLSQLSSLPLDKLKIDQSFVRRVSMDSTSQSIAETIISLGRALALEVVAEGVEREDTRLYLRTQGCDQAQGFLFGQPMAADDFATWYRQVTSLTGIGEC